ncbi:hypothetical protein BG011_001596 [Mortierella polycephala]|uniref:DUF803-domain-containing protein n=1 Tax=Mortierella polycephala TaxID=41804 RepID=A0A9P6Q525_9FUNG|nr:hypothetical protein BG011_001596 [Mortierella polycephala]
MVDRDGDEYVYIENEHGIRRSFQAESTHISRLASTTVIIGEIFNFVAYSFAPALIVTPLGALSVVVCAVLSSMVLKEKLTLVGKIGCGLCIVGAVIIVLHAPAQAAVTDIDQFKHFVIQPGFLVYMSLVIVASLGIVWKVAPKYGKTHLLVYITVCSMIGSLSVVATQGLGAAIVLNITTGTPQFNQWFIYVTIVFVACSLLVEINYLNKALNLFNAAMVTPVYYVFFTSATLVASVILFQGFSASPSSIITVVMGFFVICAGVVLLQTSRSATHTGTIKKATSSPELRADDDSVSTLEHEKDDLEPGPMGLRAVPFDAIRQIVRARTMPNSSFTTSATPDRALNLDHGNHYTQTQGSLFGQYRRCSEYDVAASPHPTSHAPFQGVVITQEDEVVDPSLKLSQTAVASPANEKSECNEKDGILQEKAQGPSAEALIVSIHDHPTAYSSNPAARKSSERK